MKKLLLLVTITTVASIGYAAPACTGGSDVLSAGFSCEFMGLTFSDFSVMNGANVPSPSMTLVSTGTDAQGHAILNFDPGLFARWDTGPKVKDLWFYFTVAGGIDMIDLTVGGQNASISERACSTPINANAGNTCTGGLANQLAVITAASGQSTVFQGFNANDPVYIYKNIIIEATGSQNAQLTSFSQSFNPAGGGGSPGAVVPEPTSFLLLGSGLLAASLTLKRRAKANR